MTYKIPKAVLNAADHHLNGGLTKWKSRNDEFVQNHPHAIEAVDIAAVQLFETFGAGKHPEAMDMLEGFIKCKSSRPCYKILCPICRTTKQMQAADKAVAAFSSFQAEELRFVTILLPFETDAALMLQSIQTFRKQFNNQLHNNADKLDELQNPFKMMGAFEIDLKNVVTDSNLAPRSQKLMRDLGFKNQVAPQYLPHLHAIVGPMDDEKKKFVNGLIEKALGQPLAPWQVVYRSLHRHRAKEVNLSRLASYMFKARLQYADNIFADNEMEKQSRYHTPFKGLVLLNYLKAVEAAKNFKGLKFDFGISSSD